jgi:hypothetical protein
MSADTDFVGHSTFDCDKYRVNRIRTCAGVGEDTFRSWAKVHGGLYDKKREIVEKYMLL